MRGFHDTGELNKFRLIQHRWSSAKIREQKGRNNHCSHFGKFLSFSIRYSINIGLKLMNWINRYESHYGFIWHWFQFQTKDSYTTDSAEQWSSNQILARIRSTTAHSPVHSPLLPTSGFWSGCCLSVRVRLSLAQMCLDEKKLTAFSLMLVKFALPKYFILWNS